MTENGPGLLPLTALSEKDGPRSDLPPAGEHVASVHDSLWRYCREDLPDNPERGKDGRPLCGLLRPDASIGDALDKTRWIVFVGAADSPAFGAALALPDVRLHVFEPDRERLRAFAAALSVDAISSPDGAPWLFGGDLDGFSLSGLLSEEISSYGFPAIFVRRDLVDGPEGFAADVAERLEILHYRNRIFAVEGQAAYGDVPSRDIRRGLFFDQQKHIYDNAVRYSRCGDAAELAGRFSGAAAVVVAAGPDLERRIGYIRENRDKAIVICVNKALPVLLGHGLAPHFVVITDASVDSEADLAHAVGAPVPAETILVPHVFSGFGQGMFRRVYFTGDGLPGVFGRRFPLRGHGTVATAAFSLAAHLGCAAAVLVGFQYLSKGPERIDYASAGALGPRPGVKSARKMYPVKNAAGEPRYATLNYLDAAWWLRDEIRESGITVFNTCRDSLVYGPGVVFDEAPDLSGYAGFARTFTGLRPTPVEGGADGIISFFRREKAFWERTADRARAVLRAGGAGEAFAPFLAECDATNVSYLLQRFPAFESIRFYAMYFVSKDPVLERMATLDFCENCLAMAGLFVETLDRRLAEAV